MKTAKNLIDAINDGRERESKARFKLDRLVKKHVKKHSQEILTSFCNDLNELPDSGQVALIFTLPEIKVEFPLMGGRVNTVYNYPELYSEELQKELLSLGVKTMIVYMCSDTHKIVLKVEDLFNNDKDNDKELS